ncbi:DUF2867 domain-containing protein [Thalassovita taeanensis]|uniref:DUF2867 domain-containing protein n=1 Tax=Thalassovita taeanensis TaxID=657014 RepID=A0A1H9GHM3_9RHOB|nr:DUF2867 domain-containing protein [Thalassovita taeanensis]SEQ49523.1 Protein of unknown function [Thalassovita taeanensis]
MAKHLTLPDEAVLIAPRDQLNFLDVATLPLPHPMTPFEVWQMMMEKPLPLAKQAFWLRDAISARFGVKKIGGFSTRPTTPPRIGRKLDFFLVEDISPTRMLLTERDRHLDVMTCITTTDSVLAITSSVKVHNTYGRLYMLPVAPAHKLIVSAMLRRLRKTLSAR